MPGHYTAAAMTVEVDGIEDITTNDFNTFHTSKLEMI